MMQRNFSLCLLSILRIPHKIFYPNISFMKFYMKKLLFFVMFFIHVMMCSQADNNIIDAEKQARIMILQSAQAIQELDKLLDSKRQEKDAACNVMKLYQTQKDFYDQKIHESLAILPYDIIAPQLHCYYLNPLETLSFLDINLTQLKITTFQNMSVENQWKYLKDHANDCHQPNPLAFVDFLKHKLVGHKQAIENSIHASRVQQLIDYWSHLGMYPQDNIKYQHKVLEKLSQQEDDVRNYRDEYKQINSELKALWYGDEQAACADRWAQVTKKILQQDFINSQRQKHNVLQGLCNEKIVEIAKIKALQRNYAKKERKLMAAEECAMQKLLTHEKQQQALVELYQNKAGQQKLSDSREQEELQEQKIQDAAWQEKQLEEKQAAKDKQRLKLARKKQAAKDKLAKKLEEQQEQAEHEEHMQSIKERHETVLGLISQLTVKESDVVMNFLSKEKSCNFMPIKTDVSQPFIAPTTYDEFILTVQKNKKNREDYIEKIKAKKLLTTEQKTDLLFEYDKNIPDKPIFDLLCAYGNNVCRTIISDESLAQLEEFSNIIVRMHKQISLDNQHISWYLYFDKTLYTAIYNRYYELHNKYLDENEVIKNKQHADEYVSYIKNKKILLMQYNASLDTVKSELKKMMKEGSSESAVTLKKEEMKVLLNEVKQQTEFLMKLDKGYSFFQNKVRDAKVYNIMKQFHSKGGILDISRLVSDVNFSISAESTFSPDVLNSKIDAIKNEIGAFIQQKQELAFQQVSIVSTHKLLSIKIYTALISSFKNILLEIGLTQNDSNRLADEMIRQLNMIVHKWAFDSDILEFHFYKSLMDYNHAEHRNYSLAQINDVVKIQKTLIEQFALFLGK